ncbi:MAG: Fis family transcriptional regulator [Myxococcaceae bacterium]|nr:Fis family transcriptional regulator [Myxococcaceae bacterium]
MTTPAFAPAQLLTNRAAVLLHGGSESDRRHFADGAAQAWELTLQDASDPAALPAATTAPHAVVYVADVTRLSPDAQRELARVLHQQEERPKLLLGVPKSVDGALAQGTLRDDLWFALRRAVVDAGSPEAKDAVRKLGAKAKRR